MRLTLRTMLAYLDDILDPKDAEELNQKIDESKFASELVHRIRSSTRRLRLGAPKLEGRGMGLDPNTVAEYLDNTLSADHVPDFEKVCLESDVHLAEVASCHQVLALVLGEPANIDQSVRERVYRIGQPGTDEDSGDVGEHDPLGMDRLPNLPPATADLVAPPLQDAAGEAIPDYMKTGSRIPVKSLAIMVICAFVLAGVAMRAMHPFNRNHPVYRIFVGKAPEEVAQAPGDIVEPTGTPSDPETQPDIASGDAPSEPSETPTPPAPFKEPSDRDSQLPGGPQPATDSTMPKPPPTAPDVNTGAPPIPPPTMDPVEAVDSPVEIPAPDGVMPPGEPWEPAAPEPANVGRFISDEQVLGRLDPETGSRFRLEFNAPLSAGDRLIVLPTFRPQVLLSGNTQVTFSGPASVELGSIVEPDMPEIAIRYGRATVVSVDDRGVSVRLNLAGREGIAVLPDATAALALEVQPYLPPGKDPLSDSTTVIVGLYATSGEVTWNRDRGAPTSIAAGQVLVLTGDAAPQILDAGPLPAWIDGRDLTQLERSASTDLKGHLTTDRPISLSLLERTDFRRIEVAVLACRCLSYLDDFEPILEALDGERHYSYWNGHYDALRAALARSRESATDVLETLERTHGEDADAFYRMLWSYSPEQLETGAAEDLVGFLENRSMIGRVLALENLRRITGKTLQFRPEEEPGQEKSKVVRWRRDLEDGLIRYKKPPTPAPAAASPEEK